MQMHRLELCENVIHTETKKSQVNAQIQLKNVRVYLLSFPRLCFYNFILKSANSDTALGSFSSFGMFFFVGFCLFPLPDSPGTHLSEPALSSVQ